MAGTEVCDVLFQAAAYEAAFGVGLAAAVVGRLASFAITETRCRNVWTVPSRRA